MLGIFEETWEQFGPGQVPTTWEEMLLFLQSWPERRQQYPDVRLFAEELDSDSLQYLILNGILTDYEKYRTSSAQNMGYDTPTFRRLMELFRSMDFRRIAEEENTTRNTFLFTAEYLPSAEFYSSEIIGLPLSIDANEPSYLSASVFFIVTRFRIKNFKS